MQDLQDSGEIIVTAGSFESLQKTAAAVAVVDAESLEVAGVVNVQGITSLLTGVATGRAGPEFQITVRGIGPSASALGVDSPAGSTSTACRPLAG